MNTEFNIHTMKSITKFTREHNVTVENYSPDTKKYYCENHGTITQPSPRKHDLQISFNPANGEYTTTGEVVFVCPICSMPIEEE